MVIRAMHSSRDSAWWLDRYFAPWATVCSAAVISSGVTPSRLRSFSDIAAPIAAASRAANAVTGRLDDVAELHGRVMEQVPDIGRQHRPDVTPQPSVQRADDPWLQPDAFLIQRARNLAEGGVEFLANRGPEQRVLVGELQVEALPGHVRSARNLVHPGLAEPVAPEHFQSRGENSVTPRAVRDRRY